MIFWPMYITYSGLPARTGQEKWILRVMRLTLPCQVHGIVSSGLSGCRNRISFAKRLFSVGEESENSALSPVK